MGLPASSFDTFIHKNRNVVFYDVLKVLYRLYVWQGMHVIDIINFYKQRCKNGANFIKSRKHLFVRKKATNQNCHLAFIDVPNEI